MFNTVIPLPSCPVWENWPLLTRVYIPVSLLGVDPCCYTTVHLLLPSAQGAAQGRLIL